MQLKGINALYFLRKQVNPKIKGWNLICCVLQIQDLIFFLSFHLLLYNTNRKEFQMYKLLWLMEEFSVNLLDNFFSMVTLLSLTWEEVIPTMSLCQGQMVTFKQMVNMKMNQISIGDFVFLSKPGIAFDIKLCFTTGTLSKQCF